MYKHRLMTATLGVMVLVTASAPIATAQEATPAPEGTEWRLTVYLAEGAMVPVPDGIVPTLLLEAGQVSGNGGCNSFSGSYQIDGSAISFDENMARTAMSCEGAPQMVEDAYLALLPQTTSWSTEGGSLSLMDGEQSVLAFGGSVVQVDQAELDGILAALASLQASMSDLDARVSELESSPGGAAATGRSGNNGNKAARPRSPIVRGDKVRTMFPDWMKDESRPESERSDNKNRERVRWLNRADDAKGLRIYARRGYCALKATADPTGDLDGSDFKIKRGKAVRIEELAAEASQYRPRHDAIDRALPAAPESPYSNDQFYDLMVAAFNDSGESKRTLVGSFYLTPEFNCP